MNTIAKAFDHGKAVIPLITCRDLSMKKQRNRPGLLWSCGGGCGLSDIPKAPRPVILTIRRSKQTVETDPVCQKVMKGCYS